MKIKKAIISSALCLVPIVFGLIYWNQLPLEIATSFDFSGNVTGYSSNVTAVFGIPIFMTLLNIFLVFALNFDPKEKNQSPKMKTLSYFTCPFISNSVMAMILANALEHNVSTSAYTSALLAIIFILAGNYLPKCKQNYTMGIRLPWTLNDEQNWNYTHRFTGKIWVIGGILLLFNIFTQSNFLLFAILIILCFIPFAISFKFYIMHKNK